MAQTTASDLIVPQVWGPVIFNAVLARAVMRNFATVDDTLVGNPGDSVEFGSWDYIGDAADVAETDSLVPVKMGTNRDRVTIKEAGKAVELTDRSVLTALGRPQDEAVRQLSLSMARKIDADLIASAYATNPDNDASGDTSFQSGGPLTVVSTLDKFDWKGYTLGVSLWGDEYDPAELAGVVIHSAQSTDLMNDPNFIGLDKIGADSVLLRGQVGRIGSVPIVISDRVTKTGTGDDTVYNALIIRRGALALALKRDVQMEKDRDILARSTVLTAGAHYATKRTDNRGIVVVKTYAPTLNGVPTP